MSSETSSEPEKPGRRNSTALGENVLLKLTHSTDEKNLIYGSIHKYSIPAFRRFGAGYVVGLSSDFRIEQDHGDDKGITILNRNESKLKSREKYIFSKAGKPRLLKIRAEITGDDGLKSGADFVSLTRGKKRKRGIGTSNSPSYRGTRGVELQREFLEPAHNSKGHVSEGRFLKLCQVRHADDWNRTRGKSGLRSGRKRLSFYLWEEVDEGPTIG